MPNNKLVFQIINNYHSCYLIPLSAKYKVDTWNEAMREAWKHLSYKKIYPEKIGKRRTEYSIRPIDRLSKNEMDELCTLQDIILERIQGYIQGRGEMDLIDWVAARAHLQNFIDCFGPVHSRQKTAIRLEQIEPFNDIQDAPSTERQQSPSS